MDFQLNFPRIDESVNRVRVDDIDQTPRPFTNFIAGSGVTITPVDDPANNEVQLTFAAAGGAATFLDLTDTPAVYTGAAVNFVRVKNDLSGLEFVTPATLAGQLSHANFLNIGTNTHAQIDTHIASTANPHATTLEQARTANSVMAGGFSVTSGNISLVGGNLQLPNAGSIRFDSGVGAGIAESVNGLEFFTGAAGTTLNIFLTQASASFNPSLGNVDFIVGGDTDANALVVDASADTVQVGNATTADSAKFYVNGKISTSGELEVNGAFNHDGSTFAVFGKTPAVQATALTTQLTTITFTAPTPDYALQTVQLAGYGFATEDEGNTLLSVVANLQTRLAELESRISTFGFLP